MGSSRQQDRSLNEGIPLPQWMKGKIDNRFFDFDESAFSPPSHDNNFFCIRYPKAQGSTSNTQEISRLDNVLKENNTTSTSQVISGRSSHFDLKQVKPKIDFSQHPPACHPFIPTVESKGVSTTHIGTISANLKLTKSQGTDDGFHGEPALCGKSIVHVANQMMSSKVSKMVPTETKVDERIDSSAVTRKGSRSLPATPLASPITSPDSSPKARRKVHANRYFTGPFIPDKDKYQSGWILARILGQSREIVTSKIEEEDDAIGEVMSPRALSRKKSISSQNLTYIEKDEKMSEKRTNLQPSVLQAKPSELREMNFWSPTSM